MEKYLITCSGIVDLPREYLEKRKIPFICYHIKINGVEYVDDLGKTLTYSEFYKKMDNGDISITSLINQERYIDFFKPYLAEGYDILHIELSSGISGTYNSCRLAQDELLNMFPERKMLVVDSLCASSGYGLLVDTLKDMQEKGATINEAYEFACENRLNIHHWFFSTNLEHYKRGGRITQASYFIGNLLNIYPLLNMDNLGRLIVRKKIHGKKKLFNEMLKRMEELAIDGKNYKGKCFISNSNSIKDAIEIKKMIKERFPNIDGEVLINDIGTTIGSHTGSGTVAIFFFGKKRID
mgnify:FL=1